MSKLSFVVVAENAQMQALGCGRNWDNLCGERR